MSYDESLVGPGTGRLKEADRALDARVCTQQTTDGLFGIVDVLGGNVALRRALTDPAHSPQQRQGLLHSLFDGRVDPVAVDVAADVVVLRWSSGSALLDALEREGVRSELQAALNAGTLDSVEDELFKFSRVVAGNRELRAALDDRSAPVEARQSLVRSLLDGHVDAATLRLALRAVLTKQRTYALTLEHYLELAAQVRHRMVAHVTVAAPLTDEQENRLKQALSSQQGRPVELQVIVDPAILGGVKVELGDDVIDGSVKRRLDDVTRELG